MYFLFRYYPTPNIDKRLESAVFEAKLTLATPFRGSLPYIFVGLLPLPHDRARNAFTEGFDTADLKDAKALLDELNQALTAPPI